MLEALSLPFFQRVLLAGLLASVACGVIGSFVLVKRITSLSGGISHAAFGGVGLGYLLGFDPMLGAAAFGLAAGLAVGVGYRRLGSGLDTLISMVWSVGMALGIVFVALAPGHAPDLSSYLFGSLLFVPWEYVWLVGALDVAILGTVALLFKELRAVCFDEEFSEVTGVPVEGILLILFALTSLAIVTLIRVVGVILAIALVAMPATISRQWTDDLRRMMLLSTGLCAASIVAGLLLSYALSDVFAVSAPPGPLIILLIAVLYGLSHALRSLRGGR